MDRPATSGWRPTVAATPLAASELRRRWSQLALAAANIFQTWEWAQTWWKHFRSAEEFEAAFVRDTDGQIHALLPLIHERRALLQITRFVGHGVADELGPVCAACDRGAALEALEALASQGDLLLVERLSTDWNFSPPAGRVLKEEISPTIALDAEGSWEGYLGARSSNFRQQIRRRARRLERGLDLRYRLSQDPGRLNADLEALFALHRKRWGPHSQAFSGPRERFHREFAARALERGWLRLWMAESRGEPVAAWYGFRFAGVDSFYQAGRDPDWDRYQVGAGLLEHSIREAFADGMREYRLLRGDEAYKQRYATTITKLQTVAVPRGTLARGAVAAADVLAHRGSGRRLLSSLGR